MRSKTVLMLISILMFNPMTLIAAVSNQAGIYPKDLEVYFDKIPYQERAVPINVSKMMTHKSKYGLEHLEIDAVRIKRDGKVHAILKYSEYGPEGGVWGTGKEEIEFENLEAYNGAFQASKEVVVEADDLKKIFKDIRTISTNIYVISPDLEKRMFDLNKANYDLEPWEIMMSGSIVIKKFKMQQMGYVKIFATASSVAEDTGALTGQKELVLYMSSMENYNTFLQSKYMELPPLIKEDFFHHKLEFEKTWRGEYLQREIHLETECEKRLAG